MKVGQVKHIKVPQDATPRQCLVSAAANAHVLWGAGRYSVSSMDKPGYIRVSYLPPRPPKAPPPAPASRKVGPHPGGNKAWLTRNEAAEYLKPWLPDLTPEGLARLCVLRKGPPTSMRGRYAVHMVADLREWASDVLKERRKS